LPKTITRKDVLVKALVGIVREPEKQTAARETGDFDFP
jgi:hypothetical protein